MERGNDMLGQTNVISRTFKGVGIKWASNTIDGSEHKVAELPMVEITQQVINNEIIMVYAPYNSNLWCALPILFPDGRNHFYFSYGIMMEKILLKATQKDYTLFPSIDIAFRVVMLQGYAEKAKNIDLLNYKSTISFLSTNP